MLPVTVHDVKDRPNPVEKTVRTIGGPARMTVVVAAVGLAILGAIPEVPEPYATIIKVFTVVLTAGSAAIIKTMTPATREKDTKKMYKTEAKVKDLIIQFWQSLSKGELDDCSTFFKQLKARDTSDCSKKFEEAFKGDLLIVEQTLKSVKKQLKEQGK